MYEVVLPLLGFEDSNEAKLEIVDENFLTIILDQSKLVKLQLVNINYLNKLSLNFDIDDEIIKKLKAQKREDFDIYFCLVIQNPIEQSIINLIAPILINQKEKILGQYVVKHKVPKLFSTIKESVKL